MKALHTLSLLAAATVLTGILVSASAHADNRTLTTIQLKHQLPAQVLPVIQPLLGSGSTAAEFNSQLVLNVTDEELAKVRKLLDLIDRQPRQLLITVRTPGSSTTRDRGVAVDGSVGTRNEVRIGVDAATSNEATAQQQQVRALEGMPAQISIGVTVPVVSSYTLANGQRVTSQELYAVNQGFNVVARVVDGRVILDIDQRNDRLAGQQPGRVTSRSRAPQIETQAISTQVSGRIGEWIPLGAINQSSTTDTSGLGGVSRSSRSDVNGVVIKVEVVGEQDTAR